jgi:tetratricopeptide (TPR) repeat protein
MPAYLAVVTFPFALALAVPAAAGDTAGEVSFPNSGTAKAQPPFVRGLALLHNFEYDDAAESFRRAQEIDSGFAMAYWGEAMTKNHPIWMEQDRDAARMILERLGPTREARLAKAPTQREKDYLATLEALYFGEGAKEERDFGYAETLATLQAKYPDDPDAAAFHALSLLGTAHEGRDIPTYMRSAAILEELVCAHPKHPGVLHYLIHSYDDPVHAPLGLRAARVYAKVAPAAAHAQHMTSHIFVALGMWDDVVTANETAVAVVNRSRAAQGQPPRACGHYNFWLEYGYLQQGRQADARKVLEGCAARAEVDAPAPGCHIDLDPDKSTLGSYVQLRARYLLDTGDWNGEIATQEIQIGDQVTPRVTMEFIRGFGAVRRGELDTARRALADLREARVSLDAYCVERKVTDPASRRRAEVLERQLHGMVRFAEGRRDEAIELLRQATAMEEGMPAAFGPPFVDKPSGELLGELLLELGRAAEARAAFEASLARTPERTAALLGLARAASRAGDSAMAAEAYGKLRKIWRRADRLPDEMSEPVSATPAAGAAGALR